jgi:hypothetical protein
MPPGYQTAPKQTPNRHSVPLTASRLLDSQPDERLAAGERAGGG